MHSTRNMTASVKDLRKYSSARLIRIFVPYLPITIAMLLALHYLPQLSARPEANYGLLTSLLLFPIDGQTVLSVAWTMQHEMVFYLLFGLAFFAFKRRWLIVLWMAPIIMASFFELSQSQRIFIGILNVEFLFGVLACQLHLKGYSAKYGIQIAVAGIAVCTLYYLLALPHLFIALGFTFIILGLVELEDRIHFARARFLVFLGAASYSIYLVHDPALSLLVRIAARLGAEAHWQLTFAALMLVATAIGCAYHLFIEKPGIALVKRWLG